MLMTITKESMEVNVLCWNRLPTSREEKFQRVVDGLLAQKRCTANMTPIKFIKYKLSDVNQVRRVSASSLMKRNKTVVPFTLDIVILSAACKQ